MRSYYYKFIILFSVLGLIALPVFISAQGDIQLAQDSLQAARPLEASRALEHAAAILFWREDLRERAGRVAFAGGDSAATVRLLTQVETLSAEGWNDLGAAYYQLGRYAESADALQRGLDMHGPSVALYQGLVLAGNAQRNLEAEIKALKNILALDDTEAAVHHRLGLLLSVTDPTQALPELMKSAVLDEAYDPAVQTMRSALNLAYLQEEDSQRMVLIGRGLGLVQEWQLAGEAFQRAVDADQHNAEAWAWLGEAQQHLGGQGGEALARAVTLQPFSASVRALYGLYWTRTGETQKALAQFQWAAAIEPGNPAYISSLAEAYVLAGELPQAMLAYQSAAELAPTEVIYWRLLALFTVQYSYQVEQVGIPAAQKVLDLVPGEAASYDLLGWTYLAANKVDLAKDTLLTALRLDSEFGAAHLHLGMTYIQMDQMEDARLHLLKAASLNPESAEGRQAAQLLEMYFQ